MINLKTYKYIVLIGGIFAFICFSPVLSADESFMSDGLVSDDSKVNSVQGKQSESAVKSIQKGRNSTSKKQVHSKVQMGVASYYGPGFHGRRTANGEKFNMHAMTAAHRTLPFGTKVKVTNTRNGMHAIVRVNDRGPYIGGRVIDLSVAAAKQIGSIQSGIANVKVEVVSQ